MRIDADHRLEDLISRARQTISAAVAAMEDANHELVRLLKIRSNRPWRVDELSRYLELSQCERPLTADTLVCRNDVCPENVVFRDGIAVALLDFRVRCPWPPRLRRGPARPPLCTDRRRL